MEYPRLEISFGGKNEGRRQEIVEVAEFIGVKSFRAKGKRLSNYSVSDIRELEPVVRSEAEPQPAGEEEEEQSGESTHALLPDDPSQMKLDL